MVYSRDRLHSDLEDRVYGEMIDREASWNKVNTLGRTRADLERALEIVTVLLRSQKKGSANVAPAVLDFGCGWGTLLKLLSASSVRTIGFDVTPWKVASARAAGLNVLDRWELVEQAARENGGFDFAVSTAVLEHVADPADVLAKIARVLKPGATVYLTCIIPDVARAGGWARLRKRVAKNEKFSKEVNPLEHLNYFTPASLAALMRQKGFFPVRPPGFWWAGSFSTRNLVRKLLKRWGPLGWNHVFVTDFWEYRPTPSS